MRAIIGDPQRVVERNRRIPEHRAEPIEPFGRHLAEPDGPDDDAVVLAVHRRRSRESRAGS
jgi:hypothetical protein